MKFVFLKYIGKSRNRYIHALYVGEFNSKAIILQSEFINNSEALFIRSRMNWILTLTVPQKLAFLKKNIKQFSKAYKEIKLENIKIIKEYAISQLVSK